MGPEKPRPRPFNTARRAGSAAGAKTKREMIMVVIYVYLKVEDKVVKGSPLPFFFVNHGGKWKLFLRR